MSTVSFPLRKNKLVLAISVALLGTGISGCSSDSTDDEDTTASVTIKANGGQSGNAEFSRGGDGGELHLYMSGGDGSIEVKKDGKAATSFTPPSIPTTASLGSNPLNITSDTTVPYVPQYTQYADAAAVTLTAGDLFVDTNNILRSSAGGATIDYASDTVVTDGTLYRVAAYANELFQATGDDTTADLADAGTIYQKNDNRIYAADGDDLTADTSSTGLSIAVGATLTLVPRQGCSAEVYVPDAIINKGTITIESGVCWTYIGSGSLYIGSGDILVDGDANTMSASDLYLDGRDGILNEGTISARGYTSTDDNGGDGAEIALNANAFIANHGSMIADGGDGLYNAGDAGYVETDGAPTYFENSGTITANGGNSTGTGLDMGFGGSAGNITLDADVVLNNMTSSTVSSNGGKGTAGGYGQSIYFTVNNTSGTLVNAGDLNTIGGDAATGDAGYGGSIRFSTYGADFSSSAKLTAIGGNTSDSSGSGGNGGQISIYANSGSFGSGHITLSGSIDVSGGNANETGSGNGGHSGQLYIYNYPDANFSGQGIQLLGYDKIEVNGGDGADGGDGDILAAYFYGGSTTDDDGNTFAASISNEVPIEAIGGQSLASGSSFGSGGNGGDIYIATNNISNIVNNGVSVTNKAPLNTSGGNGYDAVDFGAVGGHAGDITLRALHDVSNSSTLTANGGVSGNDGGYGGHIALDSSQAKTSNTATINARGADGIIQGGYGGYIALYGAEVTNTGALNVDGADASDATEGYGGNGGYIGLYTNDGLFGLNNSGSLSYDGGTGVTDNGLDGCTQLNYTFIGTCLF